MTYPKDGLLVGDKTLSVLSGHLASTTLKPRSLVRQGGDTEPIADHVPGVPSLNKCRQGGVSSGNADKWEQKGKNHGQRTFFGSHG